jgi:hypothetical protein
MDASPRKKVRFRSVWMLVGALITTIVVLGVMLAQGRFPIWGFNAEDKNTQVIDSVTRQEEVALLSLGIQGITEKNDQSSTLLGSIPGTERATLIQYSFSAKLGVDGEDVQVSQTGEDRFVVSIPEFVFIGHNDVKFKSAIEQNGVLSWLTPEIEQTEMINAVLNDDAKNEYINSHRDVLQDQATVFYGNLINSIDPAAEVEFSFSE